ncbi:hypothetical protein [Brucella oryzae]|uniref:Uncharacterized protein n=1 Tax=Brucella oryzae TaxID=335286 RepID=A0A2S7IYF3_9HYPH|nr:hypothetical protein [Brucella oryzae]MBR7651413.1 hypothetical protein [Brucella oryzae]PQA73042.1 hypothetical protein C3731_13670 [Brucella oryzae]
MKLLGASALIGLVLPVGHASAQTFSVCHGYECHYRTKVTLTAKDEQRIRNLLHNGSRSADGERKALRTAVAIFEQRSTAAIGVRDKPRMQFGKARIKGQMDCIDESTNTDSFLRYLQSRGWLKHHTVARRTSRGVFFDGRYPHWTAVIEDKKGQKWAVDSWYEVGGGPPDIMPLQQWKQRGYMGGR